MELSRKGIQSDASLELFARLLKENSSRYEQEALTLLTQGRFDKIIDGVLVVHFLRDGGCGYQISNETPSQLEEVFFQSLDEDTEFNLKLIVDQLVQSEVDAKFLIEN